MALDDTATTTSTTPAARLEKLWAEIRHLRAAQDALEWDRETLAPGGAHGARAETVAALAHLRHRKLTSQRLLDTLEACEEVAEPGSLLAAQVWCARLEVDRAVHTPSDLVRARVRATSASLAAWKRAREEDDFTPFARPLERVVELKRQEAAAVRNGMDTGDCYDALLGQFEPGATAAELIPLFDQLRRQVAPVVEAVAGCRRQPDESGLAGSYPGDAQKAFALEVAEGIGFNFSHGRLDLSAHPFCVGFHPRDVRLTWRYRQDDFRPALFSVLHEAGHGLYEQGLPAELYATPVGSDAGCGIHESQARLWEHQVGRSRGFWRWALPRLHHHFPHTAGVGIDQLWPTLHPVRPSVLRIEADATTYLLHIVVRFELERGLFRRDLEVADLETAWSDLYDELLGVRPRSSREGVLQDIHWAEGLFGYFPTYALGSIGAAQLYAAAEADLGDLEEAFAGGEFRPLLDWLRQRVHRHGGRYTPTELMRRATGDTWNPQALLAYLHRHAEAVYGVVSG